MPTPSVLIHGFNADDKKNGWQNWWKTQQIDKRRGPRGRVFNKRLGVKSRNTVVDLFIFFRRHVSFAAANIWVVTQRPSLVDHPMSRDIQWNPAFSNPQFLKPPDFSKQFPFPLDKLHCNIALDFSNRPFSRTNIRFPWFSRNGDSTVCFIYITNNLVPRVFSAFKMAAWRRPQSRTQSLQARSPGNNLG